ncbi:MAG: flagellin [Acidimicrobiia bacterium]
MRINQNIAAFNSYRNLSMTNTVMGKSLEKLSSGFRINRAADDAAGLVISQGLRAQVSGLRQATRNAQDGISVVQTAEGALNEVHAMLNRMRDLAVQSVNASNDTAARTAANNEIDQMKEEIGRIAKTTKFGTQELLSGKFGATPATTTATVTGLTHTVTGTNDTININYDGETYTVKLDAGSYTSSTLTAAIENGIRGAMVTAGDGHLAETFSVTNELTQTGFDININFGLTHNDTFTIDGNGATALNFGAVSAANGEEAKFQVGANNGETITVKGMNLSEIATNISGDVLTAGNAANFIDTMDTAIAEVSTMRGELGAVQNRFESTINNLQVATENLTASESRIRDTDMALEMVSFTRHQILLQAGTAMLGQANQLPQSVLGLLR